jgi:ATP-dependent Lon protease
MVRHKTAAPGVVLDELEKSGTGRQNGSLSDALLAMLEPVSARQWMDPYLQASVDLSHVVFLATANEMGGVPAVLRDRFRIIRFPSPASEHMPALANSLLRSAIRERGMVDGWTQGLDRVELDALAQHWSGGSIRKLRRLVVDGVLAARDNSMARA